ncbi:MAG TPA: hypothetical protein VF153_02625, partial [Candidatus Limnocylindria bacterium]
DPSCAGKEGPGWNPAGGVASTLKGAGLSVYTAPVMQAGGQPATPCSPGTPAPPLTDYINSNGDLSANGVALGSFLAFLKDNYGINKVDLVAHSDGGLWSRSAISQQQNFPGVTVTSLTTLGTPHTGSFIADVAEDLNNGQCTHGKPIVQAVCLALQSIANQVINDLGELAVEELSSDYLTTWNPEQKIGACPVTGIAGTYFNLPLPPSQLPSYYNPSDGLVGQASALNQASTSIWGPAIPAAPIPNFASGGTFPVVHGSSFSWLTNATLLNTQAVSNAVLAALNGQPSGGQPCTATQPPPTPTDGSAKVTIPLHTFAAPRHRTLPRPRSSDLILHRSSARIFCRKRHLRAFPFLGSQKLFVTYPKCKSRLRVRGHGKVLMIRQRGSVLIQIQGNAVSVTPIGLKTRRVALRREQGNQFIAVQLNGSGQGTLPAGTGPTALRVIVTPKRGTKLSGSATVSR